EGPARGYAESFLRDVEPLRWSGGEAPGWQSRWLHGFSQMALTRCVRQGLWREGGNDLLEARVAAQRVPERQKFQLTIADRAWRPCDSGQLFAGVIFVANPGSYHRQILNHQRPIDCIFFHRKKLDRASPFTQRFLLPTKASVDQAQHT